MVSSPLLKECPEGLLEANEGCNLNYCVPNNVSSECKEQLVVNLWFVVPCHQVDSRDWALNGNTISLDEDTVIDVPQPFDAILRYCASLGHKANHSFTPNCRYDLWVHPLRKTNPQSMMWHYYDFLYVSLCKSVKWFCVILVQVCSPSFWTYQMHPDVEAYAEKWRAHGCLWL